ncbi:MAG TPA: amidase [Burkholderiales bacterium]|nr:amidase [Burkholderiales bacterium]
MTASKWTYLSARELAQALKAKKVSALELARDAIARIERYDAEINAVCVRDFGRALEAARAADAAIAKGELRPLSGIPLTVKESFNVAGLATTWGFVPQKDFVPQEDALIVARVKTAGAVVLGKTNVPVGLADWQSYNEIYGTTNNPFDLARTPGGSSGGSAAALAAGYGPLSLGSDIGGSLRSPAHYCGVYAHKPTFGLVPARGHTPPPFPPLPLERDLAVVGPMSRSAGDLSDLLEVVAGPDEIEAGRGYRLALPAPRHARIEEFRVLVLDSHPLLPAAASVRAALDALAGRLAKSGARVARESSLLPDLADSTRLYMRLLFSFLAAVYPPEVYERMKAAAASLKADDRSLAAERLRGAALSHRDWVMCDGLRARLRAQWRALFRELDAVICPVMPTPAYAHDHSPDQEARRILIDGRAYPYVDQLVWPGVATLPGLPATSIPLGLSPEGLPVGAQIVGPWLEDRTPLRLAELIEQAYGGFIPPPRLT